MKKFLSLLLLLVFNITSFQILPIYAQYNSSLEKDKQKNIEVLDKVEKIIDKSIDKIDEKIKNEDISKRLREKEKEIEEYIEDTQDKIEQENSKRDIKKLLNDAKKTVVLKVVS
jgi:peptidoglycan hydrolase CwlO-like protein